MLVNNSEHNDVMLETGTRTASFILIFTRHDFRISNGFLWTGCTSSFIKTK